MTILVILASILGKVGGATISSRLLSNTWRYTHHNRWHTEMVVDRVMMIGSP